MESHRYPIIPCLPVTLSFFERRDVRGDIFLAGLHNYAGRLISNDQIGRMTGGEGVSAGVIHATMPTVGPYCLQNF